MAVFGTSDAKVLMPRNIADGMIKASRTTSVVAKLSNREPQRFGEVDYITFNDFPKAEFVEEGANKSSTTGGFGYVTAKPHKAQVTMRFNEEVQWADEDYQLGIFTQLSDAGQVALSRALDLGLIHRINPLTGSVISGWDNYVTATTRREQLGDDDADEVFRTAVGLLINRSIPTAVNGAAFDPQFSWALANLKAKDGSGETSQMRYPTLGFGTNVTDFSGVPVAQGDTVSGTPEAADTGVRAIVGDFVNGIRWGVQRNLPVEIIRFGDPDGQGDLKRANQIALRLEIVYGWYTFADRFALVLDKAASSLALTPDTITVGESKQLTATVTNSDGSTADVTGSVTDWTSATPANVTVSSTGVITGVKAGTAAITGKYAGKTGSVTVTASSS